MHNTLILTAAEQSLFTNLPDKLQEGWEVTQETLQYEDSAHRLAIRLELMQLRDPQLAKFQEEAGNAKSKDDLREMLKNINFKDLNEDDTGEIFFAMGPTLTGAIIAELLENANSDEDLNAVAGMSTMRHELLESLQ